MDRDGGAAGGEGGGGPSAPVSGTGGAAKRRRDEALAWLIFAIVLIIPPLLFTEIGRDLLGGLAAEAALPFKAPVVRRVIVRVETPEGPRVGGSVIATKSVRVTGLEGRTYGQLRVRGRGQRVALPNGDELFVPPVSLYFANHWRDEGRVVFPCGKVDTGGTWSPPGYVVRKGIIVAQVTACDMGSYGREWGYTMKVVMIPSTEDPSVSHYPGWSETTDEARSMVTDDVINANRPFWARRLMSDAGKKQFDEFVKSLYGKNLPMKADAVRPSLGANVNVNKSEMYREDFR